jgi:hypothetical protein
MRVAFTERFSRSYRDAPERVRGIAEDKYILLDIIAHPK